MLADIEDWEIMEEESCSYHNIMKYILNFNLDKAQEYNFQGLRFIMKEHRNAEYHKNLRQIIKNFQVGNDGGNIAEIDERLVEMLTSQEIVGVFIERFDDTLKTTCNESFKYQTSSKNYTKGKSVPWWPITITLMRNRTKAMRRYQRTLNNEELRRSWKNQYIEKKYQAAISEKTNSWKKHCTITTPNNPCNKVYKVAAGKNKRNVNINHTTKTGRL